MKYLLVGVSAAIILAVIDPVRAQAPVNQPQQAMVGQPQVPRPVYPDPYSYRFVSPTPEDAYRQGLINRWELERLVGPTPQAMQGPSPDGNKGEIIK
jgi:hypothetical protein